MKHKISEIGAQMLEYQEQLAREYKYKPIPRTFFSDVRAKFQKALPEWCNVSGDTISLETTNGTVISEGIEWAKCLIETFHCKTAVDVKNAMPYSIGSLVKDHADEKTVAKAFNLSYGNEK